LTRRGQLLPDERAERLTRPVQPDLHGIRRDAEHCRGLFRAELFHVAENDHGPRRLRQQRDAVPDDPTHLIALERGIRQVPG
jgi:hypothetical protein